MTLTTPNFLAELTALDASVAALFTISTDHLTQAPAPNKWSALQAIDHIVLTNCEFFPEIERAINRSRGSNRSAQKPFHYSWLGRNIIALFEPPPKLRIPIPTRRIAPVFVADIHEVRQAYEEHHIRFREYIHEALTVDMHRAKVRSPFLIERWIPLNLGTAIGALLAHERRHLYQARKAATAINKIA